MLFSDPKCRYAAWRQLGEMTQKLVPRPTGVHKVPDVGDLFKQDDLDAAGIKSQDASRAEMIDDLDDAVFEAIVEKARADGKANHRGRTGCQSYGRGGQKPSAAARGG